LDEVASRILDERFNNTHEYSQQYGKNSQTRIYDVNTKLNSEEAKELFLEWYHQEENYNYCFEPSNNDAGKFIVQRKMIIIMFLDL